MADQYLFAKPQKRDEEDEIVNPFAGNNMPELGKQNIINPFDSPDSIEEQAPPVNIFEGAEKSAEPSLDERTDSEFYEWFNYNMANPDFAPTDSQYDRFNKIRINKGIKLGKVFDAATEVPAMLWDEMVKRPGKSQVVEMAKRYQKSYSNKLRGGAPANEKVMKDFGLNYDDSQRIKNPLDRRRPINLGLSMGPIRPSNDSIQKVRDQLKEAWINHNYKIFNTATEGAELIASIQGLSKDEKAEQEKTIEFLMREKVNSVNSIYRQNLKNILPERLHKKIDSMSDKQLKGLFDGSKVEPPNRALFFGKEFLTYGLRGIPSSAEGVARATADLGVLGTQLRHYLNDKISPDDVEGQRERLKLHRQILMDRMAKHQGESTYIGDTLRAARMDSVADWFDRSIDPATAEMMSYMVGPEAAAGSLVKAPVKAGAKSATAPTRSQMLRDAYTKNIQAPLVKAEKAVGDAITEVLPSAAMKAAGATGGVLGEGAIKVGELPEKIAGKMAFMLTRNSDTAAKVERALGKGTYGVGALDIAGGLNMPIPLVGSISVVAGKLKLMGQLGKSLGEGAKAAGRAWNQKSQKQFLARVAFDPKASPALRNFANWASTIDPALGWAANIGNGMGRGALTGGILTLPTKDEAAIGGGLGIGAMLGGGGSFVGLPYASKLRNAEGQAADIKWFGEETEKHGYMTREQYDLLPDKLKLYAADAQMILGDHPEHGFKIILTPDGKSFRKAFEENGGIGMASDSGVVIPNKRGDGGVAIVNASKKGAITTLLHEIGGHSVTRGQDMGDLMTALLDNYGADGISKMKDEYALNLLAGEKVINNPNISLDDALMSVAKTPSEVDAYIKEKDLSNPSWWAEEVFASHFAKKALEEGGLLGMSKETRMTIATRKALVEKGGAMLQRIGINIRPDGSIPDPTGLFEVSQIKDSPELDLFVRNYLVERANLLHEIRISNKPKARKGAKIAPERLKDHPAIKWDWNEKSGLWETDFATKTDDGVVTLKSNSEVKQTLADRLEASNKIISDQVVERSNPYLAPKDDGSGGIEIKGTKLPPEFYDLPQFTKSTKDHARAVEEAIDGDTTFQGWYNAIGTSRNPDGWARSVQKGLGNMRTRFREWKPLGFQTTKAGHILETVLDVDATLAKASQFQSEGRLDQYFNGSLEVFHRDLTNYLENHKSGEPGEKGIGPDKRNFIRAFLGVPGGQNPLGMTMPTGESLIKTFRLDRMGEVNPTNRRGFFFDYMKVKQNFMPAGKKKGLPPDVGEVSKGYKGKRTLGKLGRATERNKELQDLAQNVDQMSQAEWNAAVERLDPIIPTPDSKIPNPSMFKAMDRSLKALDKNGKPFVMDVSQYKSIRNPAPGSNVKKVRIDISAMERAMEAYSRDDIETPLHPVAFYDENGIGYASHLYIKDGTFSYPGNIQPRILETSQGRSKDTFIFTEGEVIGGPLPSRAELMRVNNKGERVWTEAGVNPLRHGYAYDKNNPSIKIHGGDRMLLANNSVWVRNARKVEAVKVPGLRRMGSGEFEGPEVRYMPAGKSAGKDAYSNLIYSNEKLPKGVTRDEQANLLYKGKQPQEWSPEEFKEFGEKFDVKNLGPLSEIETIKDGEGGGTLRIPGGLHGKFTFYDLLWIKNNNPEAFPRNDQGGLISEKLHAQITDKLARTMTPEKADNLETFNRMVFGMLSPNAPLLPNEFGYARLKFANLDQVKEIAKISELLPKDPSPKQRKAVSDKVKKVLGIGAKNKGGLGIGITQDFTNVADFARLWLKDPEWFNKAEGESWGQYVDRVGTQLRGLGTKTASFGGVWQDPAKAMISAIDRHMAKMFADKVIEQPEMRARFENGIVSSFNKNLEKAKSLKKTYDREIKTGVRVGYEKGKKTLKRLWPKGDEDARLEKIAELTEKFEETVGSKGLPDPSLRKAKTLDAVMKMTSDIDPAIVGEWMGQAALDAMGAKQVLYRNKKGEVNPNVRDELRLVEFISEPEKFKVMSDAYREALNVNEEKAKEMGVAVFPAQWTLWDRIRGRVEPHEVMFPGYHKLPKMGPDQIRDVMARQTEMGYATAPNPVKSGDLNPSSLAYFMPAGKGGDIFYSNSSKALESPKVRNSATGPAMLNDIIRQDPAARQEMKWIDLDRWLMDKKGKVTKEEVQDFIDANQIAVVEKVRGGDESPEIRAAEEAVEDARQEMYDADDRGTYQEARDAEMAFEEAVANLEFVSKDFDPQFDKSDLSLPGAVKGSYRELELMLPTPAKLTDAEANKIALAKYGKNIEDLSYSQLNKIVDRKFESFKDSHFETDENVFAHVRFNERIDADGKRMLFIEEVQSDWAASGRERGFNEPYINGDVVGGREESVPAAPFVSKQKGNRFVEDDKWRALAMKRMIRWGADNGFDRVGWITGRDTADRYNLSKFIDRVEYQRLPGEDRTMVSAWDKAGNKVIPDRMVASKDMKRTVGRDLAEQIAADKSGSGEFEGLELAVGGEGHKQFYDIDLPNYTGKYVKKWGGKVGMVDVSLRAAEDVEALKGIPERTTKAHYVDITPEMKADVQQGQAMFMPAGSDAAYMRAAEKGDTKGAQLLVDQAAKAAGYGTRAFHGTASEFTKFNADKIGTTFDIDDDGFYFTSNEDLASQYADAAVKLTGRDFSDARVVSAYLRITNPWEIEVDDTKSPIAHFESGDGVFNRGQQNTVRYAIESGYDALVVRNKDAALHVVFDPNQIKSADPITYDDAGNIIPLSERFQPSSDDIRYMPAGEGRAPRRMGSATSRPARTRIPMGAVAKQLRMERDLKELKRN